MHWIAALQEMVNRIPPCDRIDCIPDGLEQFIIGILTLLSRLLALVSGGSTA